MAESTHCTDPSGERPRHWHTANVLADWRFQMCDFDHDAVTGATRRREKNLEKQARSDTGTGLVIRVGVASLKRHVAVIAGGARLATTLGRRLPR